MTKEINPKKAYFIKLGEGGKFEEECILQENTIRLGYQNPLHKECLAGDWEKVHRYWIKKGKTKGIATDNTRQIRIFYEGEEDVLWITFFRRKLYWGFAEKEITKLLDGARTRQIKGGWNNSDIDGKPLTVDNLSGKLTKIQGYQRVICDVDALDYLVKKINHQKPEFVQQAENAYTTLVKEIEPLIQNLTWKDFEILIDLIFAHAGWQRLDQLGKTQKSIDLALISPVTGNQAFVQVKSRSSMGEFTDYIQKYQDIGEFNEMYFVLHTKDDTFDNWQDTEDVKLWDVEKVAKLVVNSGLTRWLIKKTA